MIKTVGNIKHFVTSSLETAFTRTWPGLSARDARRVIAEARAQLHRDLLQALGDSRGGDACDEAYKRLLPNGGRDACAEAFEAAFGRYGKALLAKVADEVKVGNVEDCLDRLQRETMPTIIAAIEPDLAHQTLTYDSRVADIVGDWEAQLDRAYTVFRAGNSAPLEVGDGTFRFRYTFRLRVPEHRDSLRTRLQDAMAGALIEIEPALRARLPTRTGKRRQGRGFAADAEAHFKLANIVERIGSDWGSRLEEVCNAFDGKVACPEDFCSARVKSWSKVAAEVSVDAHLRGRVRSYIRYRLNWIVKNRQSSH